ncbi:MAG: hypothetical protein QOG31_843, partial [Thermoplasmata archaeon]|nr:hypothetical protein [Thermoplasmata archaeon]
MRWAVPLAALLALPAVAAAIEGTGPPVAVQATAAADSTLYFHVRHGADFPITPQEPDPAFRLDDGIGLATHSLSCVPPGTPLDGLTQHEYTTYYGFAALGKVGYGPEPQPYGGLHAGIAAALELDAAAPLTLHWFMSTYGGAPPGGSGGDQVPVPGVVVRATVRLGERLSPYDTAYNAGGLVAQGQTPPTTLAGTATAPTPLADPSQSTPGASVRYAGTVDGFPVYGFTVPMPALLATVPQEEGFNVRVDVFQRLPTCPDPSQGYVMANVVRVHTSPGLRPSLGLREREPLRLEATLEQFLEAQVLHVSAASPWGREELDAGNATLEASPTARFVRSPAPSLDYFEGNERLPLSQVWVWNRTLLPGTY